MDTTRRLADVSITEDDQARALLVRIGSPGRSSRERVLDDRVTIHFGPDDEVIAVLIREARFTGTLMAIPEQERVPRLAAVD